MKRAQLVMRKFAPSFLVIIAVAMVSRSSHAVIDVVASSEDATPGGNGSFMSFVGAPLLNSSGHVAFFSTLSGTNGGDADDTGLFRGMPGDLTEIAREGDTPPEGNGQLGSLEFVSLNDQGEVSFASLLTGTTNFDSEGIYRGAGGSLTTIARDGMSAPNGNGTFATFFSGALLNADSRVAFQSFLDDTMASGNDDSGLFIGDGNTTMQIAREGDPVPNGNETLGNFFVSRMAINATGQVAFPARIIGPDDQPSDVNYGLYRSSEGVLTEIVRSGQPVPDGNGVFNVSAPLSPAFNNSGQAAFTAPLIETDGASSDNSGIFLGDGTTLVQLARKGQAAPDAFSANGVFQSFDGLALNGAGDVALLARLTGTSGGNFDNAGVFFADGMSVAPIARKGGGAPAEFATGELFPDGTFSSFSVLAINGAGQIAFHAQLSGTSDGALNNDGIFLFDPLHGLMPVVRKGDGILNSAIDQLVFSDGIDSNGNRRSESGLNDAGQVAFQFRLRDGREGVAIFTPIVAAVTGDYNNDGVVNAADYTVWRDNLGTTNELPNDPLGGEIGTDHYDQWKVNFGSFGGSGGAISAVALTVPEPMAVYLFAIAIVWTTAIRWPRR